MQPDPLPARSSTDDPYGELPQALIDTLKPPPRGAWLLPGEIDAMEKVVRWVGDTPPTSTTNRPPGTTFDPADRGGA